MNCKEVQSCVKALGRQAADEAAVLAILHTLEAEVVPTERLLRDTRVGVEVNKFKKSQNPEIAAIVKRLITSWKDAINKSKRARLQAKHVGKDDGKEAESNGTTGKDSKDGSPVKHERYSNNGKPRNAVNDNVNTHIYGHKLRDKVIQALYNSLAKDSEHSPASILANAKAIELAMNDAFNAENNESKYKDRYRIIYSSVISKNNPELKIKINNGDISPEFLVSCEPRELAPTQLQKKLEDIDKQNLFNAQGATIQRSVTDRFTCGKCKEKKVSYYQLQTRSADEPLTTFCTCEACGNRWKFS